MPSEKGVGYVQCNVILQLKTCTVIIINKNAAQEYKHLQLTCKCPEMLLFHSEQRITDALKKRYIHSFNCLGNT